VDAASGLAAVKVLSVVGNRPQFVKSAPLSLALRHRGIDEVVLHTGQHYDPELSQIFFDQLGLAEPGYRLEAGGVSRAEMLARMEPGIRDAIAREEPDWVLVYGDTNSTLAGARAARAHATALAHVEAGLRSGDLSMPEEHNRIETDELAQLLLCPDERSAETLRSEGVAGRAEVVGDVMADACFRLAPLARERSDVLERLALQPGAYVVATIHREANVARDRLGRLLDGLGRGDERVILPAHPRTRAALASSALRPAANTSVIDPLGYLDLAALASQARVVATDSGGLQKEAYWYGVPCVTLRPSTEWVDTVAVGANVLVDDDPDAIEAAIRSARMPAARPPLYGDGHASERVAERLVTLSGR
jgi:UDP-N-acetylglucosamine 2-epimerase